MDLMARRWAMMTRKSKEPGILPDDYTQLKYIESNNKQYIVTDVLLTTKRDKIKVTMAFTNGTQYNAMGIWGGIYGQYQVGLGSDTRQSPFTKKPFIAYLGYINSDKTLVTLREFASAELDASTGDYTVAGVSGNIGPEYWGRELTEGPYLLCAHRKSGGNIATGWARLQYAEIVGKGIFIPCRRKSDGEIGVFNTVTQTFLTNSGSGTFGYETMNGAYTAPA